MPLVFSAISPHSPALLPGLASSKLPELKHALKTAERLMADLKKSEPDVVIIITPHGAEADAKPQLNVHAFFQADFQTFGDMATKFELRGAYDLAAEYDAYQKGFKLISEQLLDYGASAPLAHFDGEMKFRLLPLIPANGALSETIDFGRRLARFMQGRVERIALIASAELSQKLSEDSPAGFAAEGKIFDEAIVKAVKSKDLNALKPAAEIAEAAGSCGLNPIAIFLGAMSEYALTCRTCEYESPVGVGWLTAEF